MISSWRARAAFIASGCSSHKRVELSRSVNRNVTVPVGGAVIGPSRRTGARSVELQRGVAHQLLPAVRGVDLADGPRLRAHDQRLRARSVAPVAHALEEHTIAHTGRGEEHVLAA